MTAYKTGKDKLELGITYKDQGRKTRLSNTALHAAETGSDYLSS